MNSAIETEQFLWDLHRVQSEMMVEYYYAGLREILQQEGLTLSTERYTTTLALSLFTEYPSALKAVGDELLANGHDPVWFNYIP